MSYMWFQNYHSNLHYIILYISVVHVIRACLNMWRHNKTSLIAIVVSAYVCGDSVMLYIRSIVRSNTSIF